MTVTKYPYTTAVLRLNPEPSSYNEPLNFTCSYTSNITAIVPDIKNGEILNTNSTAFTNVTPANFHLPYSTAYNNYTAKQAFNVSTLSTHCTGQQQNFTTATSPSLVYNLTLQKLQNATITSSILANHNLNSTIKVITNTPFLKPVFDCNGVTYPVKLYTLSQFYSAPNISTADQYNCFWNVTNTYNVEVSKFLEASAVKPVITAIKQKNITTTYLKNSSINTYYNNSMTFPNLANITWTYNYTYNTDLIPYPNSIQAYKGGVLNFTYSNESTFMHNFTVPASTTDNYSIVYKWDNGTYTVVFPHENYTYNNTFGNNNNISEYVSSVIYPKNEPNGTIMKINNSCSYQSNLIGLGPIIGTNCLNYTLTLNYRQLLDNLTYSWIRENGTNVSYKNVSLTQDILNQSLKGYELYNLTNRQYIPVIAKLNTTQYKPDGWNESIETFTVSLNSTKEVNISAVGNGTKIVNETISQFPSVSFTKFLAKWKIIIPNSTAPWIKSNPVTVKFPISYLPYFEARNYTQMEILNNIFFKSTYQSGISAFSAAQVQSYFSSSMNSSLASILDPADVLQILYTVPQQFIKPPTVQIGTPTFAHLSPLQYVGYIAMTILIITAIILLDTRYKKQFDKFIKEIKKGGKHG
jgi:hypothetical protein